MLYFAIPLRSKASSKNWKQVETLFNRTLASLLNQTDSNFKVLVCCHDIPELNEFNKIKQQSVEFIQIDYPTPGDSSEQMMDKYYKKAYLMKRVKELGGGFVMLVDADDLVSNQTSAFVKDNKESNGWFVSKGYIYDYQNNKIKEQKDFFEVCGTSAILKYSPSDLPDNVEFKGYDSHEYDHYIFAKPHRTMVNEYERIKGLNTEELPFRGVAYTINNGENHSIKTRSLRFSILVKIKTILKYKEWSKATKGNFTKEFSID